MSIFHSLKKNKNFFENISLHWFFVLSFVVWMFSFRKFFSFDTIYLSSDATSYYEHIKFYIDNLLKGVYPLWDPLWHDGSPNEFFLRRLGSFNPFYSLLVVFRWIRMPAVFAHILFLSLLYFFGAVGFYFLAKEIFKDKLVAFTAFLLLYFSSLGTRIFDSFIVFEFVWYAWFFYFFIAFSKEPKKGYLLGVVFALMNILTMYIPFYFLVIFLSFLFCFLLFYPFESLNIFKKYIVFIKANKRFTTLMVFLLLLALLPGIMMIVDGKKGGFIMPIRSSAADSKNTMEVGLDTISRWGIMEDILYSLHFFSNLRRFKTAILYIPPFAFILGLLGLFTRLDKRTTFLFVLGSFIFLISSYHFPFYEMLYNHVFFYRYFRNLHFFLWWALLPITILFSVGFLRCILCFANKDNAKMKKVVAFVWITFLHALFLCFLIAKGRSAILSSYMTVLLSYLFFVVVFYLPKKDLKLVRFFVLMCCVCVQPIEVYHYFSSFPIEPYNIDNFYPQNYMQFSFQKDYVVHPEKVQEGSKGGSLHYASKWFYALWSNMNTVILNKYLNHKLAVYDRVEILPPEGENFTKIEDAFWNSKNVAFVHKSPVDFKGHDFVKGERSPLYVDKNTEEIQVLKYSSNDVLLQTHFDVPKFLVYNDSYNREWRASLNGRNVELYRANVAFKGIFLPKGENVVHFYYGYKWRKILNGLLLVAFYCVLLGLVFVLKEEQKTGYEN